MMYIAEIDLKKKKRQLIPLTRICLFGYVDGKRKNLEKNCTFAFINMTIYGIETYPYRRLASGPDLFRLRPGGGARGFPRFSDKSIGGAADGCPVDRRRCVRRDEPFRGGATPFLSFPAGGESPESGLADRDHRRQPRFRDPSGSPESLAGGIEYLDCRYRGEDGFRGDRPRFARRPFEEPGGRTGGALPGGAFPPPRGLPEGEPDSYVAGIGRMYRRLYAYADARRNPGEAIVALGHLHATGAELSEDDRSERAIMGGLESVSADTFDAGIAYTALGHIHKAQRIGGREAVRYAGSPLPMSFSEKNYRHQVIAVEIEEGSVTEIEAIGIPRVADLMRIPDSPLPPEEVLRCLAGLPEPEEGREDESRWPYVEIRVLLTEPDPTFRHRVEEALVGKAVRLTSIVPSYPRREGEAEERALSYNDLQKIAPLDMLRHTFAARYGGELPEEIETLFNEVMREVSL